MGILMSIISNNKRSEELDYNCYKNSLKNEGIGTSMEKKGAVNEELSLEIAWKNDIEIIQLHELH